MFLTNIKKMKNKQFSKLWIIIIIINNIIQLIITSEKSVGASIIISPSLGNPYAFGRSNNDPRTFSTFKNIEGKRYNSP